MPSQQRGICESVREITGVGPARATVLAKMGVETVEDMLRYYPRMYLDRTATTPIDQLTNGQQATVSGRVSKVDESRPRPGLVLTKIVIDDETGRLTTVWFNQRYVKQALPVGTTVMLSGKVEWRAGWQMATPEYETIDGDETLHTGGIVPVYPATEQLSTRILRKMLHSTMESHGHLIKELLPTQFVEKYGFIDRASAVRSVHFPDDWSSLEKARQRLIYEEFFLFQLVIAQSRQQHRDEPGIAHTKNGTLVQDFLSQLPFRLTRAQERVWQEIQQDMESTRPMSRLVQGDVGSGKTVLALLAMVKAVANGYQAVMMAPTEILAEQHYLSVRRWLEPLGIAVGWLVSGQNKATRTRMLLEAELGGIQVMVGTHALLEEGVQFARLGVVIIDEQHRFGVRQRLCLQQKGQSPDTLVMTATPIPRTLALTLYGDLDVSSVDELPPGRLPVKTYALAGTEKARIYKFVREQVEQGHQAFVVCPLVEESEKLAVESAVQLSERLSRENLAGLVVGLLHGRMNAAEKEETTRRFREREIQILVSTTVIEVGVDIPNATIMVIEGAERFGLAQLHQLRGRVGRGSDQSYCILVADPNTDEGRKRVEAIRTTRDGFALAEVDLEIRGPGEFFGTRQSGSPQFRIAELLRDSVVLGQSREDAQRLLDQDPHLQSEEHQNLLEEIGHTYASWSRDLSSTVPVL